MKALFGITSLILTLAVAGSSSALGWEWITPDRVYDMQKDSSGLWLIDVRDSSSFEEGHMEGAVNMSPLATGVKRFPKQKILVLADSSLGFRWAREAAAKLATNGHEKVFVLEGGVVAWKESGYPVVGKVERGGKVVVNELRWALENGVHLRIFDLRDKEDLAAGTIPGSETMEGKNFRARVNKLSEVLKRGERKGLAGELKEAETAVLVMPLSADFGEVMEVLGNIRADVRYLDGGYPAWKDRGETKTIGTCPVCPAKERKR